MTAWSQPKRLKMCKLCFMFQFAKLQIFSINEILAEGPGAARGKKSWKKIKIKKSCENKISNFLADTSWRAWRCPWKKSWKKNQNKNKSWENKISNFFSLCHFPATHECPQKMSSHSVQLFGRAEGIYIYECLVLLNRYDIQYSLHTYLGN